jgi:hypothetical protein
MKNNIPLAGRMVSTILSGFLVNSLITAAELSPFEIAAPQQARIDKILELKTEAMKLPGMRSEDGVLGKQVEALMDEIAQATTEEEMLNAEKVAMENIRAKIVLWAKDRKARPADYEHFAKEYLNRPKNDAEAMVYFYRDDPNAEVDPFADNIKPKWPPRRWIPRPVPEEEAVEKNRLLLEYLYFMPPIAKAFDDDESRRNFLAAILKMNNVDESYFVFFEDAKIWYEIVKHRPVEEVYSRRREQSNWVGSTAMILLPRSTSSQMLSKYYSTPFTKSYLEGTLDFIWVLAGHDVVRARKNHEEWQKLAKLDWSDPNDVRFSAFILSIPTPDWPARVEFPE